MRAHLWKIVTSLLVVGVVLVAVVVYRSWHRPPPQPAPLPEAVVTMGDSTLSGEGGGHYEPGTNGEDGNWCHRSPAAPLHQLELAPQVARFNLACSGAKAKLVGSQPSPEHSEGSQAERLAKLAHRFRITHIVVQVGANDDPGFTDVVNRCVNAWASRAPRGCAEELRGQWSKRVAEMRPKVVSALRDVRAVMSRAGYGPQEYSLTLQSYASPVTPDLKPELQNLSGCPFRTEDLRWLRDAAVPDLSEGLRRAAQDVDARFLDLSRSSQGHEACTGNPQTGRGEWFTRLTVDWEALQNEQRAPHAMQESFHANVDGHRQFGRCLSEFLGGDAQQAACLPDDRGNLHAVAEDQEVAHP